MRIYCKDISVKTIPKLYSQHGVFQFWFESNKVDYCLWHNRGHWILDNTSENYCIIKNSDLDYVLNYIRTLKKPKFYDC